MQQRSTEESTRSAGVYDKRSAHDVLDDFDDRSVLRWFDVGRDEFESNFLLVDVRVGRRSLLLSRQQKSRIITVFGTKNNKVVVRPVPGGRLTGVSLTTPSVLTTRHTIVHYLFALEPHGQCRTSASEDAEAS